MGPEGPVSLGEESQRGRKQMLSKTVVREARLWAEPLCACQKEAHGHRGRCNQFLMWTERGGTGRGAWEACAAMILADRSVRSPAPRAMRRPLGGCRWERASALVTGQGRASGSTP